MIRNLLASTAIATLLATGGAYAQTTTAPTTDGMQMQMDAPRVKHADGHLASNLIGENVYNGTGEDAQNIGEVTDLVVSPEGEIQAIVVGVGGFLGIGQKAVALEYALVQWHEQDGEEYIVVETTREALEAQEDFDVAAYKPLPADAQVGNTQPATAQDLGVAAPEGDQAADATTDDQAAEDTAAAPADDAADAEQDTALAPADDAADAEQDTAAAPADDAAETDQDMAVAPADDAAGSEDTAAAPAEEGAEADQMETAAIDRSTLTEVDMSAGVSAENFIGTTVYGADEENIGEVGDVILTDDGSVDAVIVDVGGFLGIGEKQVAISMDELNFMQDEGENFYLYTSFSQEQLEAQPAYDESTFADARDEQLLINE